jgi:outer membrane protein TolC
MTPRLGISLVSLALASCAVGPDFKRPAAPDMARYTPEPLTKTVAVPGDAHGAAQRFVDGQDLPGEWWTAFGSPPMDALVQRALKANPTLKAAQSALRQASELVAAQRGAYFPQVSAGLSASRNLTPTAALSPTSPTGNPYYSLITPRLSVSFVPDVFGANQRAVEPLRAQAENQRFQLEATYLTLTSNVVAGAVREASLRGQIEAISETIKIETDLLAILRRQLAAGAVSDADVAAQEAALSRSLDIVRKQLALGQIPYTGVLTAENTYQQARQALVQARGARLADTVALFQALGGGW